MKIFIVLAVLTSQAYGAEVSCKSSAFVYQSGYKGMETVEVFMPQEAQCDGSMKAGVLQATVSSVVSGEEVTAQGDDIAVATMVTKGYKGSPSVHISCACELK